MEGAIISTEYVQKENIDKNITFFNSQVRLKVYLSPRQPAMAMLF